MTGVDIDQMVELMRATFEANGGLAPPPVDPDAIVFEPLRSFLARELPPSESLVGTTRGGTNLLPRYGWVMPWGREGCGKTSVLVDLLFHAAAGRDWLVYPVERPVRIVCVVNEGIPGGFQDKLRQKVEAWEGDAEVVLDNLAIYVAPWGEFSFRDEAIVEHARAYVRDFGADYVALDPLHTFGTSGSGTPQETEEFKHVLRRFGLWEEIGVITAHHSNKGGMVSGDWARHPDTVVHLEKDGKNPATKLTLQKARPADPHELGVPVLLKWVVDSLGYERHVLGQANLTDADFLARIVEALEAAEGPMTMTDLKAAVPGDDKRIGRVAIDAAQAAEGPISNVSTRAKAYSFVLRENAAESVYRVGAQTRLDTDLLSGGDDSPGSPGDDPAESGRTRWVTPSPPEGVTPTGYRPATEPNPITEGWER